MSEGRIAEDWAAYDAKRKTKSAYDAVGWKQLSPYARSKIDEMAREDGVTLHVGTDEETLRKYIQRWKSSW